MSALIIGFACAVAVLGLALLLLALWTRHRLRAAGRLAVPDMVSQDPASEPQWFYRRVFTWAVTLIVLCLVGVMVAIMPRGDLQLVALALIGLCALLATYYIIAPSAPEIAAIVAAWRRAPPPSGDQP